MLVNNEEKVMKMIMELENFKILCIFRRTISFVLWLFYKNVIFTQLDK